MARDIDGADFVTDDNRGGYYVCQCQQCEEVFSSRDCSGGGSIADTGDYDDALCPHCGQADPADCTNPNLVWNVQQKKINALKADLDRAIREAVEAERERCAQLAEELGRSVDEDYPGEGWFGDAIAAAIRRGQP